MSQTTKANNPPSSPPPANAHATPAKLAPAPVYILILHHTNSPHSWLAAPNPGISFSNECTLSTAPTYADLKAQLTTRALMLLDILMPSKNAALTPGGVRIAVVAGAEVGEWMDLDGMEVSGREVLLARLRDSGEGYRVSVEFEHITSVDMEEEVVVMIDSVKLE